MAEIKIEKQCLQCDRVFEPRCQACEDKCTLAIPGWYLNKNYSPGAADRTEEQFNSCLEEKSIGYQGCLRCNYKQDSADLECLECQNIAGRKYRLENGKCLIECGPRERREEFQNVCVQCRDYMRKDPSFDTQCSFPSLTETDTRNFINKAAEIQRCPRYHLRNTDLPSPSNWITCVLKDCAAEEQRNAMDPSITEG